MTTLHEMTGQYLALQEMAKDADADPQAMLDTIDGIQGEITHKAESIVMVVQNIGTDVAAIDEYIKKLNERKQIIKNREEWVLKYLRDNMQASGIKKIECPLFTITLAQGREVVHINNEDELPDDMVNVKTVITPDKKAIMQSFKAGEAVPGAHLERNEPTVRIK